MISDRCHVLHTLMSVSESGLSSCSLKIALDLCRTEGITSGFCSYIGDRAESTG